MLVPTFVWDWIQDVDSESSLHLLRQSFIISHVHGTCGGCSPHKKLRASSSWHKNSAKGRGTKEDGDQSPNQNRNPHRHLMSQLLTSPNDCTRTAYPHGGTEGHHLTKGASSTYDSTSDRQYFFKTSCLSARILRRAYTNKLSYIIHGNCTEQLKLRRSELFNKRFVKHNTALDTHTMQHPTLPLHHLDFNILLPTRQAIPALEVSTNTRRENS